MDNNSTEKNYEILSLFCIQYKNIHIYRSTIDYGYSEINNIGVDKSYGKYILFLNNDTFMIDKWLDSIIDLIHTNNDILKDHYFGGKIMNIDNTVQELGCFINNIDYTTTKNINKDDIDKVDYVSACALFLSKDMFNEVNGFSSEFNMFYYEDIDLQMKLKKHGYILHIIPEFMIYHINNITTTHIKNIYDIKEYMKQKYKSKACDTNQIDYTLNSDNKKYDDKIVVIYDEKYKINKNLIQLLKNIEIYNSKNIHVDILYTYHISSYKIKYYCKLLDIHIGSFNLIDTIVNNSKYIMIKDIKDCNESERLYNIKNITEKHEENDNEIEIFNIFSLLIQCVINSENIIIIYERFKT
jgi:GT2 family glycosyltransferase